MILHYTTQTSDKKDLQIKTEPETKMKVHHKIPFLFFKKYRDFKGFPKEKILKILNSVSF